MKKTVSILIAAIIVICSLAPAALASVEQPDLRIAVASDLHYNVPRERLEGSIDDEIYWYANRRAAMDDESGFIIDEFLRQCAQSDECDYVLISGDLADNGKIIEQEHLDVAAKLRSFEQSSGKQVFVINGNHDCGNGVETDNEDFKRIYAEFGYDLALVKDDSSCSYTANLGNKYRLIALDSCDPDRSTGDGMSKEKIAWVLAQAKAAKDDGRYPILMMHHNLLNHMPLQPILSKDFIIRNHLTTADTFANAGIRLVFTGHKHCSDAAVHTSPSGNTVYDFATTALSMYPLEYRVLSLSDDEISYNAKVIDSIDTEALTAAVEGYGDEQLALMNAGLNSYAKGFLKKGIEYRLSLSLSMEKIGIAQGEPFYNLVNTAVSGLTDILEAPLYGEGGIKELAAQYSIDIPDSDYVNGWDLATDLVAMHYEGEEAKTLDSIEVTILLRLLALILRDDLAGVGDEVFFEAANSLFASLGTDTVIADLTKLGTKVFGPVTPGEYFIIALASPILYEFAYDSDSVNDNNGVLAGYGAAEEAAGINAVAANIKNIASKLFLYLTLFMKYLMKIFSL